MNKLSVFILSLFLLIYVSNIYGQETKDKSTMSVDVQEKQGKSFEYKTKLINTLDKGKLPQKIQYPNDRAWMVLIPAGEFNMGTDDWQAYGGNKDEAPAHAVYIESFYIDQYEVTNRQYLEFCRETKHIVPEMMKDPKYNDPDQPVVGISYTDAKEYAKWAEKRLPTEAEWEKAARGTDSRIYPWGNEWDSKACNNKELKMGKTSKVGEFSKDKSPYDVYDMAGNVSEWVEDAYDDKFYSKSPKDNPVFSNLENLKVIRGGNYYYDTNECRVTNRTPFPMNQVRAEYGFRCVKDMKPVVVVKQTFDKSSAKAEIEKNLVLIENEFIEIFKTSKTLPDKFLIPSTSVKSSDSDSPSSRQDILFYNLTDTDMSISVINPDGKVVVYDKVLKQNGGRWSFLKSNTIYFLYYKFLDKPDEVKRGGFFFADKDRQTHIVFDMFTKYKSVAESDKKAKMGEEQVFNVLSGQYRPPYNKVCLLNKTDQVIRIIFKSEDSFASTGDFLLSPNSCFEKTFQSGHYYMTAKYEKLPDETFRSDSFEITSEKNKMNIILSNDKPTQKTYTINDKKVMGITINLSLFTNINMNEM